MERVTAKEKLLDAAVELIRARGYSATSVEDLCEAAGVTKGAFFHHFASKDAAAVAAADHFSALAADEFAEAAYHRHNDPLARILGYVDHRKAILQGGVPAFTCLVGTMVQEAYATSPAIREACERSISGHAATLVDDIARAKAKHAPDAEWSAESLALHTQAVIQGAFILAKSRLSSEVAADSLDHLKRYIQLLFQGRGAHRRRRS